MTRSTVRGRLVAGALAAAVALVALPGAAPAPAADVAATRDAIHAALADPDGTLDPARDLIDLPEVRATTDAATVHLDEVTVIAADGSHRTVVTADVGGLAALDAAVAADAALLRWEPVHEVRATGDPLELHRWEPPRMALPQLRTAGATGAGVRVAVLDTGVRADHEDLPAVERGFDAVANAGRGDRDVNGHGTRAAGLIAAARNGVGLIGAAPDATIVPVRVLDDQGNGSTFHVVRGIDWAVDAGVDVINLSLGARTATSSLQAAVRRAEAAGVLLVASSGNNAEAGNAANYPAAFAEVIAVGATDRDDARARFSVHGPHLELVAPGDHTVTTDVGAPDRYLARFSGTSAAAPLVAGVAAAVWSEVPDLTAAQLRQALRVGVDDLGPPGRDDHFGFGLLRGDRALAAARATGPPPGTGPASAWPPATCRARFTDVAATSAIGRAVGCLGDAEVAGGYRDGSFQPARPVTREQMASFIARAVEASGTPLPAGPVRASDPVSATHAPAVGKLDRAGIASGFRDGTFRGQQQVTRAQMASFLDRAAELALGRPLPRPPTPRFPDVSGTHAGAVDRVAHAGIALGGGDGRYRPDEPVTRGHMTLFLSRWLDTVTR